MADHHDGVRTAVRQPERVAASGELDSVKSGRYLTAAERSAVEAEREDLGRDVPGRQQRTFSALPKGRPYRTHWTSRNGRSKQNALRSVEVE